MDNKVNSPKQLLNDSDEIANSKITWSPDGSTFAVAYMLANQGRIVLYDAQGNEKQIFKPSDGIALFPQFVDNDTLLYVSMVRDNLKIMALDVNSNPGKPKEVVTGSNFELSPDKRSLAYLVRNGDGNLWNIKVDAIDSELQVGATLAEAEVKDGSSVLTWSPDNRYLLYSDEGNIWALNTKDGSKKQLVSDMFNITRIIWDTNEGIIFTGIPKEAEMKEDYTFSTYRIKLK
jgi:Tol biopolymer transport system component